MTREELNSIVMSEEIADTLQSIHARYGVGPIMVLYDYETGVVAIASSGFDQDGIVEVVTHAANSMLNPESQWWGKSHGGVA